MYTYKAKVIKVYDGDTITADIDLGFGIWMKNQTIRLYGINTPEVRGEERERGTIVRDWLCEQILNKEVILNTFKDKKGKYGRYLAEIIINDRNINSELVEQGMAVEYMK
jgi:micrococcal nuclease